MWEAALAKEKEALEQPGEDGKPKAHSASSTKQFAFVSMQYANFLKEVREVGCMQKRRPGPRRERCVARPERLLTRDT